MGSAVERFKKYAKALLLAVERGDTEAVSRANLVVYGGVEGLGLMKAQHVVVVESGFKSWKELLDASEVELRLAVTMKEHLYLNSFGIGLPSEVRRLATEEQQARLRGYREILRRNVEDVVWTIDWLKKHIEPIKTINTHHTSYSLKEIAEAESPRKYLTNGTVIAAGIIAGYPVRFIDDFPNVQFGMSGKSIRAAELRCATRETTPKESFMSPAIIHIKETSDDAKAMCGYVSPSLLPWWESASSTKRGGNATCGHCIGAAKQKGLL